MEGYISKIQRFSLHDGDGVRTTIFLKGCNLKCFWCHNPETLLQELSIQTYFKDKCIGCGECFKVCKNNAHKMINGNHIIDRKLCTKCGECAKVCYSGAIIANGEKKTSDEIINEVLKDNDLYKVSKGGITVSGREPMLQIDFIKELFIKAKEKGIKTAIETAGNVSFEFFKKINDYTDLYMYDIKSIDNNIHKEITSMGNELILENLNKLDKIAKKIYIRMPIMKGINDSKTLIEDTAKYISNLSKVEYVDILPIHTLASSKYHSLDIDYSRVENSSPINKDQINEFINIFKKYNIVAKEN